MSITTTAASPAARRAARSTAFGDKLFAGLCRGASIFVLILLGAIIVELFIGGLPA